VPDAILRSHGLGVECRRVPNWQRGLVVAIVLLVTAVAAHLIDRRIARRQLDPAQATRYRVLRRSVSSGVVLIGILSALLVVPQVRAVAGALLASSAVLGIVIGFAAQRTLGNFVAGLLIAFSQPLRLGDAVTVDGERGVVEEIGLTYTFIRTADDARLVIPNEKLASDTIRNSTIRSRERLAEITLQVPLTTDLNTVIELLRDEAGERHEVVVTALADEATVALRVWAPDDRAAERLESELRVRAHARLRAAGVYA
jgi:small-conductance mechanosensitive channel